MAATVLNSPRAVQLSLFAIQAFVALCRLAAEHKALMGKPVKLDARAGAHDEQIAQIPAALRELLNPPDPGSAQRLFVQPRNRDYWQGKSLAWNMIQQRNEEEGRPKMKTDLTENIANNKDIYNRLLMTVFPRKDERTS